MLWEPAPGTMLAGKYRLERALASGGMGSVWLARHTRLDADVAVKLMSRAIGDDPSSVARFEREAKACAQLQSPHVVGVHDFGVEDGVPYMVMELLRGEDLGSRIDRVGRMSLEEAAAIAIPIGKALRIAHDVGLIHRDLKPRNIFIAQQGDEEVVKLVDFGIARETKTKLVDDRTTTGVVMGSPFHMSPEQAQALVVDHRSDLWSLGVVLYRLVTGVRPFEAKSATSVLVTICTVPHCAPTLHQSGLPPAIDAFFSQALAKDPERRFQNAREMVDAFVGLTGDPRLHDSNKVGAYVPSPKPSSPSGAVVGAPPIVVEAPAAAPAPEREPPPAVNDASASQALHAVSTGSQPRPPKGRAKVGLAVAVVAAVAAAALVSILFRVELRGRVPLSPSSSIAGSQVEVAPLAPSPSSAAIVAPTASSSAVAPASASASAAAAASASASAPAPADAAATPATPSAPAPIRGSQRRAPPPAGAPAEPAPTIDPFTGLPVAR